MFFLNPGSWFLFNDFVVGQFNMITCRFHIELLFARNTMIRDFHNQYLNYILEKSMNGNHMRIVPSSSPDVLLVLEIISTAKALFTPKSIA